MNLGIWLKGVLWLSLNALNPYSKMEERNDFRMEFSIKRKAEIKQLKNSPLTHTVSFLEENTTGTAKRPFDKEVSTGVNLGFNRPHQQDNSQSELKGKEK